MTTEKLLTEKEEVKEFTGEWKAFISDIKPYIMQFARRYNDPRGIASRKINSDQLQQIFNRMLQAFNDDIKEWVGDEYEEALKDIAGELFYPNV
jgi:archaellum biogenesis protein FlaJ (TadC family)